LFPEIRVRKITRRSIPNAIAAARFSVVMKLFRRLAQRMGEVYLAQDKQLDRRVAIKFPSVTQDEHQRHARFCARRGPRHAQHPHIATNLAYEARVGNHVDG